MTEEEKIITREKHLGRVAHGHKLAALMKKGKEEVLHNKEQPTVQSTKQSSVQSTEQSSVQSTVQSTVQSVMSMALVSLLSLPLVFVYFLHITLPSLKNSSMKRKINYQNDVMCFKKI